MTRLPVFVGAALFAAVVVSAQTGRSTQPGDVVSGTWELNLAKSRFIPASRAPKSQTRTYVVKGNQETARHTGVDAQGNSTLIEFTVTYDGKPHPVKGYPDWDAIMVKPIDAYVSEFTQYRAGKATLTGRRMVSKDGKTMTITAKGTTAKGEPVDDTIVLEKK